MPIWWDAQAVIRDGLQGVLHVRIAATPKKSENLPLLPSDGVGACNGRLLSLAFCAADRACLCRLYEARLPNRRPANCETLDSVSICSNLFGLFDCRGCHARHPAWIGINGKTSDVLQTFSAVGNSGSGAGLNRTNRLKRRILDVKHQRV